MSRWFLGFGVLGALCLLSGCSLTDPVAVLSWEDASKAVRGGDQQSTLNVPKQANYQLELQNPDTVKDFAFQAKISGTEIYGEELQYDKSNFALKVQDMFGDEIQSSGTVQRILTPEIIYLYLEDLVLSGPLHNIEIPIAEDILHQLENQWINVEDTYDFGFFTSPLPFSTILRFPHTILQTARQNSLFILRETKQIQEEQQSWTEELFPLEHVQYHVDLDEKQREKMISELVPHAIELSASRSDVQREGFFDVKGEEVTLVVEKLIIPLYDLSCDGSISNTEESEIHCSSLSDAYKLTIQWSYEEHDIVLKLTWKDYMVESTREGTIRNFVDDQGDHYLWEGEAILQTVLLAENQKMPLLLKAQLDIQENETLQMPSIPEESEPLFRILAPLQGSR